MIYSPIKIYKTQPKSEPIFFLYPDKIKLLIVMTDEEFANEIYKGNIKKSVGALGYKPDTEVHMTGIPAGGKLNWFGLDQIKNLKIIYFGAGITPFTTLELNNRIAIGDQWVYVTYSMSEIVKEQHKKNAFWNSFKSLAQL